MTGAGAELSGVNLPGKLEEGPWVLPMDGGGGGYTGRANLK